MCEIAIAMPQILSASSCKSSKDEVSFTIINQDKLPLNMSISGEQILKPFDSTAQKLKPNVIVHPTRRLPVNTETNKNVEYTTGNAHQNIAKIEESGTNKRNKFRNRNNSRVKMKIKELKEQLGSNFSKVLGKIFTTLLYPIPIWRRRHRVATGLLLNFPLPVTDTTSDLY